MRSRFLFSSVCTPILATLIFLLAACSQNPSIGTSSLPPKNLSSPPDQWAIKAKLGIRTETNGNTNSGSVTLNWEQQHETYTIRLQGALGQGNAIINGNRDYIEIKRPGKAPLYSTDANRLILDTFGWNLPINDFSYWIRGMINPQQGVESVSYNDTGTLNSLEQSQWSLSYSRYKTIKQWQLPGRIRANQNDAQLTLIIREWRLL